MPDRTEHRSFTVTYDGIVDELISTVSVLPGSLADTPSTSVPIEVEAVWDTGSTVTCIKPWLIDRLKLPVLKTNKAAVVSGIGGSVETSLAFVNIRLTHNIEVTYCPVCVINFPGDEALIIGMDIITMGDFAVCDTGGKTSFSFIIPPLPSRINFADNVVVNKP